MSGTTEGGKNAAETNKKRHGKNFYAKIGAMGGKKCGKKGFALNPELAKRAGAKGGASSKRASRITTARNVVKILRLHGKGLNAVEIAKKLGLSAVAVRYHIRKNEQFEQVMERHNG